MKKILMTIILAAAVFGASGYTVHRSFKNGYPAGSAPSQTGASIGVNGAKLNSQDARPAKGEKLKDDGTCWAITEKGTRCKNHKDGEKDYCKLHAADKRVKVTLRHSGHQIDGRMIRVMSDFTDRVDYHPDDDTDYWVLTICRDIPPLFVTRRHYGL